jgi:hypothetical protein
MSSKKVHFVSEPVQHQGGVVADVMTGSIATSTYSQAETFLRETLQNACDQRLESDTQIKFVVDLFQVSGKKKEIFDDFFKEARLGLDPLGFLKLKDAKSFEAMIVADVGTVGLVGPLDASIDEAPSNFAGFFFNVGRQSSDEKSGGSFGLGRTVLTNASEFSTILVYSQFSKNGKLSKRFMGMAIRGAFAHSGRRYTGRHWFGEKPDKNSGLVKPFEDKEAESFAKAFGMDTYLWHETGFVAMVIGNALITNPENAALAKAQREQAILDIQQAACVYGWPHMLGSKKNRSVSFHFSLDHQEIPEKDPSKMPGLREFVKCYEALNTQVEGVESKEILFSSGGAKKEPTGTLAWLNIPSSQSDRDFAKSGLIPIASVALMRQANFIVRYMDVTQKADQISTRGVFKTNESFDSYFRKSEPVAHDQWNPAKLQLKPNARNPIKQTLEGIKETFKEIAGFRSDVVDGSASVILGNVVGRLLDGLALTGPPKPVVGGAGGGGAGGGGGGGKTIQIFPVGSPKVVTSNQSQYEAIFKFQVIFPKDQSDEKKIEFSAYAILENGNPELDPPPGVEVPKILGVAIDGQAFSETDVIDLNPSMNMKYLEVTVSGPQGVGSTCRWKAVD